MSVLNVRSTRDLALQDDRDPNFRKLQNHFKNRLIKTKTTGDKTKTIHAIEKGPIGRYMFSKDGRETSIQATLPHLAWTLLTSTFFRSTSGQLIISHWFTLEPLEFVFLAGMPRFRS
jgi:hypothetical protein